MMSGKSKSRSTPGTTMSSVSRCIFMRAIVVPTLRHQISLVQLMEQDKRTLRFCQVVVDPHFVLRNKLVHIVMSTFSEINIKYTSHKTPVDNPDTHRRFKFFP